MKVIESNRKIEFANSLRGIAVLLVLLGHYIFVFNSVKGDLHSFPALDYYPFPWAFSILSPYPVILLNIGQVAVAFFFLVSGFVIPNAAARLSGRHGGRLAFLVGRALRIYPTYIVGLLISISALWFASYVNSVDFSMPISRILSNMSLFRDWLGHTQIDGVVWTLEIEAKFYVFVMLFWSAIGKGRLYPIIIVCIAATLAAPLKSTFEAIYDQPVTIKNFIWTFPYLLYMCMGIVFNYHLRKIISTKILLAIIVAMFSLFVYIAKTQSLYEQMPASYGFVLVIFTLLYLFAMNWSGGPVIRFFAKISYPMYASHAALGYTGMAYMISVGIDPVTALVVQISLSTAIAFMMHIFIESPTHEIGKRMGKWLTERSAEQKSAAAQE